MKVTRCKQSRPDNCCQCQCCQSQAPCCHSSQSMTACCEGGVQGVPVVVSLAWSRMLRVSCLCFPKVYRQDTRPQETCCSTTTRHTGDQIHDLLCFIVFPSQSYSCCVQNSSEFCVKSTKLNTGIPTSKVSESIKYSSVSVSPMI